MQHPETRIHRMGSRAERPRQRRELINHKLAEEETSGWKPRETREGKMQKR